MRNGTEALARAVIRFRSSIFDLSALAARVSLEEAGVSGGELTDSLVAVGQGSFG
jgi:hypothetical protein